MNEKYITLFRELAQGTAVLAENVMEYNRQQEDENGERTAVEMRDQFQDLAEKFKPDYKMSKSDAAQLLVASFIQINQLKTKLETVKTALAGYQQDIIPKLQTIVDAPSEEEATKIADEKFVINEETNT